ncbi:MAG: ABC transporter permease [Planctomycetaceae bacterium]|nr:ABC transporter permease [Planctomycetaceae bacterium]
MSLLVATLAVGLVFAVLALGIYLSFRVYQIPDITADGSFPLGAAVTARMLKEGADPWTATLAGVLSGALAGMATGFIHTRFKVNAILSGILVMTALYSVNLRVMGSSNLPITRGTLFTPLEETATEWLGRETTLLGRPVPASDLGLLAGTLAAAMLVAVALSAFLRTELGTTMRATGDNARMVRALGTSTDRMIVLGLALSNALVAFAGSLFAQMQLFADAQMGIGVIVFGLASVIIGSTLVGPVRSVSLGIAGAIMGAVLFRLLVAIAIRLGLDANDLKLVTAVVVLGAIVGPGWLRGLGRGRAKHAGGDAAHGKRGGHASA